MPGTATNVTMKGNPVTLVGNALKEGDQAPDCALVANDLSEVKLSSLINGKKAILSVVPSLDTPVCDVQTKRFNAEASQLPDTVVLTISMDLPFAQSRWCAAAEAKNVQTLSDYREAAFGKAYGVFIKEFHLLTRAIFVVDQKGTIRYKQVVTEITSEPEYQSVIDAVKKI